MLLNRIQQRKVESGPSPLHVLVVETFKARQSGRLYGGSRGRARTGTIDDGCPGPFQVTKKKENKRKKRDAKVASKHVKTLGLGKLANGMMKSIVSRIPAPCRKTRAGLLFWVVPCPPLVTVTVVITPCRCYQMKKRRRRKAKAGSHVCYGRILLV